MKTNAMGCGMIRNAKRILAFILIICSVVLTAACSKQDGAKSVSETLSAIGNDENIQVNLEEKLKFSKIIDGENWNMQGGDTDGQYGYYALNDGGEVGESRTRIYKIDLSTWEIVQISQDIFCGHANDVTYIPEKNQLAVTWCERPIENATMIDAETLEEVGVVTYPTPHPTMDYSSDRKQYVFGSTQKNNNVSIYDETLEFVAEIPCDISFAKQCIESDDTFIYGLQSPNTGGQRGYIFLFNWEGEYVRLISFDIAYESENICVYGDKMILAVNDHKEEKTIRFYELTFSASK